MPISDEEYSKILFEVAMYWSSRFVPSGNIYWIPAPDSSIVLPTLPLDLAISKAVKDTLATKKQ